MGKENCFARIRPNFFPCDTHRLGTPTPFHLTAVALGHTLDGFVNVMQGLRHVFCPSKRIETVGLAGAKRPSLPPRQRGKNFKNAKS